MREMDLSKMTQVTRRIAPGITMKIRSIFINIERRFSYIMFLKEIIK